MQVETIFWKLGTVDKILKAKKPTGAL